MEQETSPKRQLNRNKDGRSAKQNQLEESYNSEEKELPLEAYSQKQAAIEDNAPLCPADTDTGLINITRPSYGRGNLTELVHRRSASAMFTESPDDSPRFTFNASVITEQELSQALKDARETSQSVQIRDVNRAIKVSLFEKG